MFLAGDTEVGDSGRGAGVGPSRRHRPQGSRLARVLEVSV